MREKKDREDKVGGIKWREEMMEKLQRRIEKTRGKRKIGKTNTTKASQNKASE